MDERISYTYDTLNANRVGDFGHGWDLDLFDLKVRTDLPPSGEEDIGIHTPFFDGTRIHITLPDGTRESFTFRGVPLVEGGIEGIAAFVSRVRPRGAEPDQRQWPRRRPEFFLAAGIKSCGVRV